MPSNRKLRTESVLVVDYDLDTLDEMTEALRDQGLTVHEARNAGEALSLAEEKRPAFVLMDFNLPGVNGREAIAAIRKFLPDTTFIMISGLDNFCRVATTRTTKTTAVLKQPISLESVSCLIREKLDSLANNLNVTDMLTAWNWSPE